MDDTEYTVISYSKKEFKFFLRKIKKLEQKVGKRLKIDELMDMAIKKYDDNFINFLLYNKTLKRRKIIEYMLVDYEFDFWKGKDKLPNYSEEEVNYYESILEKYWKDGVLNLYETINLALKDKNFKLINYLDYLECRKEEKNLERKILEFKIKETEILERDFKTYINKVFKNLKGFDVVEDRKDADAYIVFSKKKPFTHDMRFNNLSETEYFSIVYHSSFCQVFLLKNKNKRDNKTCSLSFIKYKAPSRKINKY